jgi:hypothetical protein
MAQAKSAHTTIAPESPPTAIGVVEKLHHIPTAIDRSALMRRAHQIARKARPHTASYREALSYGLRAAWGLVATAREFAAVRARVPPVIHTAERLAASRRATQRCGASYMPF